MANDLIKLGSIKPLTESMKVEYVKQMIPSSNEPVLAVDSEGFFMLNVLGARQIGKASYQAIFDTLYNPNTDTIEIQYKSLSNSHGACILDNMFQYQPISDNQAVGIGIGFMPTSDPISIQIGRHGLNMFSWQTWDKITDIKFRIVKKTILPTKLISGKEPEKFPWCSGRFKDRSVAGDNIGAEITPVPDRGDSNLIQGNHFVVSEDGLWLLLINPDRFSPATILNANMRVFQEFPDKTILQMSYQRSSYDAFGGSNVIIENLLKDDKLILYINNSSGTTMTSITVNNRMRFYFGKIAD